MNKYRIKSYKHKKQIIQYLIDLGTYTIEPRFDWLGVCSELTSAYNILGYRLVRNLSTSWPLSTGSENYPISMLHSDYTWKYSVKEGKLRRELCLHLAKELGKLRLSYKENQNEYN